ncbi:MAG TPA: hypothetical protein VGL38_12405 [bacterium]|jgi:hypothetical protein
MPNTISLDDIEKRLHEIDRKIKKLEEEKTEILRAKTILFVNDSASVPADTGTNVYKVVSKSLDVILWEAFQEEPDKKFTEDDIAQLLAGKRLEGVFTDAARNLRGYARPVLGRMARTGQIKQGKSADGQVWYKKA